MPDLHTKSATIQAQWVALLANFLSDEDLTTGRVDGIQVEPLEAGGVVLMASDGLIACRVVDPTGWASEPMVFEPSPELIRACTPTPPPPMFDVNAERVAFDLPDWLLPGKVEIVIQREQPRGAVEALVLVYAKEELPKHLKEKTTCGDGAGLYVGHCRVIERRLLTQAVFEKEAQAVEALLLDPELLRRLVVNLGPVAAVRFSGPRGPIFFEPTELSMLHHFRSPGASVRAILMPMGSRAPKNAPVGEEGK